MSLEKSHFYRFGSFRLDPAKHLLLRGQRAVPLMPKAFDTLLVLVENRDRMVGKEELMKTLWPDSFVEEANLAQNVAVLRRALGDSPDEHRYILTIPGRGYRFAAKVNEEVEEEETDLVVEHHSRSRVLLEESSAHSAHPRIGAVLLNALKRPLAIATFVLVGAALALNVARTRDRFLGLLRSASVPATTTPATTKPRHSIAVLPLENLSGDREQDYFAEGMTDELTTDLAQVEGLRVISRTSAMQYKSAKKTAPQIGRELSVDALIEGTVERVGDRVRIRAQLIDCATDRHLWGKSYDREVKDVLALQSEAAREIVEQIQGNVASTQSSAHSANLHPINASAYEAYLKGRYFWNKRTPDGLKQSIAYFEQAIAQDSSFAAAYAGLADSYSILGSDVLPADEARSRARAAANKALELDSTIAEGHAALALVEFYYDWNWKQSAEEFRQAIKLNPNYATAHQWYSYYLTAMGRFDEAIEEAKRAQQIDPLSLAISTTLASRYYYGRQYDEAIELNKKTLELDPSFIPAHDALASAYAAKGMWREAMDECQKELELSKGNPSALISAAYVYARAGKRAEARKIIARLQRLSKRQYISAFEVATVFAALGDADNAFAWLEKAYLGRESQLPFLEVVPRLDPLRSDPRFQDLMRRVHLAQ